MSIQDQRSTLVKCAEIFWCEKFLRLNYQCTTCWMWFHASDSCAKHVATCVQRSLVVAPKFAGVFFINPSEFIQDEDVDSSSSENQLESDDEPDHDPTILKVQEKDPLVKPVDVQINPESLIHQTLEIDSKLVPQPPSPTKRTRSVISTSTKHKLRFKTSPENELFFQTISSKKTFKAERNLVCDLCDASLRSRFLMYLHMHREHIGYDLKCKRCNQQFSRLSDLKKHAQSYPPDLSTCEICGKVFKLKVNFVHHLRIHTGERPFECNECGQRFVQSSAMKVHIRVAHTGERPYKCSKCPLAFFTRYKMKVHDKREHLHLPRERNHKCDRCEMTFYSHKGMVEHFRTHTGEKPHICEFCGRGFAKKNALDVHRNIHMGNSPYKCKFCDSAFHSSAARRSHEKGVHKAK